MKVTIGGTEYDAEFNGFTPIAYSRCFSETMENGKRRPKDIADAVSKIADSLSSFGLPAIVPLLEILYACIKTANPKFDVSFDDWVSALPPDVYNLERADGWATDVMGFVEENFFPSARNAVDTATAETASAATA